MIIIDKVKRLFRKKSNMSHDELMSNFVEDSMQAIKEAAAIYWAAYDKQFENKN